MFPNYLMTHDGYIKVQLIETAIRRGDIPAEFRTHYKQHLPELHYTRPPSTQDLKTMHTSLYSRIYRGLQSAERQGKKLLVLIGEDHINRKCLLIEKIALLASKQLGINTLLTELCCQKEIKKRKGHAQTRSPVYANAGYMHLFAEEKLGMKILPCDPLYASGGNRERAMCASIASVRKNCICVVGRDHLEAIQNDPAIRNNYELICINSLDTPVNYNPHMLFPEEMTQEVMRLAPVSTPFKITNAIKKLFSFFSTSSCPVHRYA